jgi:hypothetical protein
MFCCFWQRLAHIYWFSPRSHNTRGRIAAPHTISKPRAPFPHLRARSGM